MRSLFGHARSNPLNPRGTSDLGGDRLFETFDALLKHAQLHSIDDVGAM
jgi:hypothetical protein